MLYFLVKQQVHILARLDRAKDLVCGYRAHVGIINIEPARTILTENVNSVMPSGSEAAMVVHSAIQAVSGIRIRAAQRRTQHLGRNIERGAKLDRLAALLHAADLVKHKPLEVEHEYGRKHFKRHLLGGICVCSMCRCPDVRDGFRHRKLPQCIFNGCDMVSSNIKWQAPIRLKHNTALATRNVEIAAQAAIKHACHGRLGCLGAPCKARAPLLANFEPGIVIIRARWSDHVLCVVVQRLRISHVAF